MKTKNIYEALALFQNECPIIYKGQEGSTGSHKYKYADLPSIYKIINPLLHKFGLMKTFKAEQKEDFLTITAIITHIETGEQLTDSLTAIVEPRKGITMVQALGSTNTYLRRYTISNVLDLVTDADDDGASGKQYGGQLQQKKPDPDQLQKAKQALKQGEQKAKKQVLTMQHKQIKEIINKIAYGVIMPGQLKNYYSISEQILKEITTAARIKYKEAIEDLAHGNILIDDLLNRYKIPPEHIEGMEERAEKMRIAG